MTKIEPKDYSKLAVTAPVVIRWLGAGEKRSYKGGLLYAYSRSHAVADDTGRVTHHELRPARAGVQIDDVCSWHFTNGFEVWRCDD